MTNDSSIEFRNQRAAALCGNIPPGVLQRLQCALMISPSIVRDRVFISIQTQKLRQQGIMIVWSGGANEEGHGFK